jgi:DNA repair exonuclease SbcCD ATPase subunit
VSGDGEAYRVVRSGGDAPAKLFRSGTEVSGLPVQKRAPVRIFGQRELQSYAQDPTLRREFVAAYGGESWARLVDEERALLSRLHGAESLLSGLESELQQAESLKTELADLKERLDRARARGVEEVFQRLETVERANQQLAAAFQWPNRVSHAVEGLRQTYPAPTLPDDVPVPTELLPVLSQIEQASRTAAEQLSNLIEGSQPAVEQALAKWSSFVEEQRHAVQHALADAGFADLRELSGYQQRAVQIEERLAALARLQEKATQHEAQRGEFLRLLADTRRRQSRLVEEASRALTEKVGQRVRVKIEPLSDTSQLLEALSAAVKGQNVRKEQLERLAQHSPGKIASALRAGAVAVQKLGCTGGAAATLAGIPAPSIRAIEQTAVPDVIRIEINVGSDSKEHWIDVDQASPGQRATAMLALALSSGTEPLIIDQPEDDLDNRYIYEEVVKVLGRVCGQRQVIVATHNANIPVLGDAEMILALDAAADRSSVLAAGGLENPVVAHQVRHILEGGDEAFRARQARYEAGRGSV